jgi:2,4-dienoyl-CoA reductase-like NADH-dependent reductase (Old Yellow Enzyme family)
MSASGARSDRGDLDFVAEGGALIENPIWSQKVRSGQPMAPLLAQLDCATH